MPSCELRTKRFAVRLLLWIKNYVKLRPKPRGDRLSFANVNVKFKPSVRGSSVKETNVRDVNANKSVSVIVPNVLASD